MVYLWLDYFIMNHISARGKLIDFYFKGLVKQQLIKVEEMEDERPYMQVFNVVIESIQNSENVFTDWFRKKLQNQEDRRIESVVEESSPVVHTLDHIIWEHFYVRDETIERTH